MFKYIRGKSTLHPSGLIVRKKTTEINKIETFLSTAYPVRLYRPFFQHFWRLKVQVNSHNKWNVSIALWFGCKKKRTLTSFCLHVFQSVNVTFVRWHILHNHTKLFINLNSKCQCSILNIRMVKPVVWVTLGQWIYCTCFREKDSTFPTVSRFFYLVKAEERSRALFHKQSFYD